MDINYTSLNSVIGGFNKILQLADNIKLPCAPTALILVGAPRRPGLSPTKIASKIISRKSEAGLPIGNLPSGDVSPDEIMERIRIEEIVNALQQDAKINVAVPLGIPVQANGVGPTGPVSVVGTTIKPVKGYGIMQ
jgi:hypothetical protein